jgi:hypothetical protein
MNKPKSQERNMNTDRYCELLLELEEAKEKNDQQRIQELEFEIEEELEGTKNDRWK